MWKFYLLLALLLTLINLPAQDHVEIEGNDTDIDGNVSHAIMSISNHNYSRYQTKVFSDFHYRNGQVVGLRARGTRESPINPEPGDRIFGTYGQIYFNGQVITPKHICRTLCRKRK